MRWFVTPCLLALTGAALAQSPTLIDPATAAQHLIAHPGPAEPPIAAAAHVYGDVLVQASIDATGHVTAGTILKGPLMLQGAAVDSVRKWVYQPFGSPATTVVTLSYTATTPLAKPPLRPIPDNFTAAVEDCHKAMLASAADPATQVKLCAAAARQADALFANPDASDLRRAAYLYAANALLHNGQFQDSLNATDKAIALVERGYGDAASPCTLYVTRAEAEWGLIEKASALRDLTTAEESERSAIATIQSDPLRREYTRILKNILGFHARMLQSTGNSRAAQAMAAEAAQL
jgi:hypothetical protein